MKKLLPLKITIGWREMISLPDLSLTEFHAKIDTGARTSALHASNITKFEQNGEAWVSFIPDHDVLAETEVRTARILHERQITNTSGVPEGRFIIATHLRIGERKTQVELSLTDRSDMKFPVIIGRTALRTLRLTVDPGRSWLVSPKPVPRNK